MDTIPQPILGKLIDGGYDSVDKLPNVDKRDRWKGVKKDCRLTGPELTQLLNNRFPVQQGN